jgi:acetyl/propionyl-CoA carboxylase alpha subunit
MEMDTRLLLEHPAAEATTRLDLQVASARHPEHVDQ